MATAASFAWSTAVSVGTNVTCRYCLQRPAQKKSNSGACPACWWYLEPLRFEAPEYYALLRRLANRNWAAKEGGISTSPRYDLRAG